IAGKLELTEAELAQLLSTNTKDSAVKAVMKASQEFRQERDVVTLKMPPSTKKTARTAEAKVEEVEPAKPDVAADKGQKSLFDF
ncbi:MAG: hypothetical protein VX193_02970, partial [Candidatus Thermoplasmatota archaeon]|nr:hypothetical protein [Candidatus Thermoplasmatota archaeon]